MKKTEFSNTTVNDFEEVGDTQGRIITCLRPKGADPQKAWDYIKRKIPKQLLKYSPPNIVVII